MMKTVIQMKEKPSLCFKEDAISPPSIKDNIPLDNDFRIFVREKRFALNENLRQLHFAMLGLCINGNAVINTNTREYNIKEGDFIVIFPDQPVSMKRKSDDFTLNYIIISQSLFNDIVSDVSCFSPLFYIHIRRKNHYQLTTDEISRFKEYYTLMFNRVRGEHFLYQKEYILNVLKLFYLDLYNNFKNTLLMGNLISETRKEKLVYNFFLLIIEYYKKNREIYYYANKLNVTPKYLTAVTKEVSGRSPKEWISVYTVSEISRLLGNTSLNIQEITVETKFSNQASLGRFFKKHTGMSPTEYRTVNKNKK